MRYSQRLALSFLRTKFKLVSAVSKRKAAEKAFLLFCTPQYRNLKKLPRVFEQAEKIDFPFQNYRLRGYQWNKDATVKCLILHGFESSIINFDRYIMPLVKKGYCVMGFDAPAHGRSTGKTVNALIYKQFIEAVQKEYGPFTRFIAHSLGGLALSIALEEMKHDENTRVAMIAPAAETTTAVNSFFRFLHLPPSIRADFDRIIEERSGHPAEWFSVSRAIATLKANILLCQDRDDDMTPMENIVPIMERKYSHVEFLITDGLGHRRIYRDNKVSKAIIEFL